MLRVRFFRTNTVPVIGVSSVLYQCRVYASDVIPLNKESFLPLCENLYSRFKPNPFSTSPLLLQHDDEKHCGVVSQYSFEGLAPEASSYEHNLVNPKENTGKTTTIDVPLISPVNDLSGFKDLNGDVVLQGCTLYGLRMSGRPLCKIAYTPKWGPSQQYLFYALKPIQDQSSPITIPRFQNSEEAKQIVKQKEGAFKAGEQPFIDCKEVLKRMAITNRMPEQNDVMGLRAVDAYQNCADKYQGILHPPLKDMLLHSASIMHLSTLHAMDKRQEAVPIKVRKMAHHDRLLRTEWLHLLAFFSYPMHKEPQKSDNLGAARACVNTRMMLLEYLTRWFALNVPFSRVSLDGRFDLLLDTHLINTITHSTTISTNDAQCKLTQEIDALTINPEQIHGSDLAMAVATVKMLLEKAAPLPEQTVKMNSSACLGHHSFFSNAPLQTYNAAQRVPARLIKT